MKKLLTLIFVLFSGFVVISIYANPGEQTAEKEAPSLIETVELCKSDLFKVSFDRYKTQIKDLPIGIFDSGIGGLTVLEAILQLDVFDNVTHEPGPDGRPDFEDERFIYLGDQANMPYGNYSSEQKTDFLRELIIKDVVFLLGERYWLSATAQLPLYDKPPVKAIVIACNTATAYGLDSITAALKQWRLPVQVIGIVDVGAGGAVRAITEQDKKGAIAVLATVGTCKSEGYIHAIAQKASEAGIIPPIVIQQGCLGLAGAIERDPSYIRLSDMGKAADYRGPAVGSHAAPIDVGLIGQYGFESEGLLGDADRPATWRLNSVKNYIRYHTASLMESYRRSGDSQPISTVILACTHFPIYEDDIAESLERLRDFRRANGEEPYKHLIAERLSFIDPADMVARQLYETLAGSGFLIAGGDESALRVDEFYISVPNTALAGVKLTETGEFTYEYKYGRESGHFEYEYVKRVPMSSMNLSLAVRNTIRMRMPVIWNRLVTFNRRSPRTRDLPDSSRIAPGSSN